MFESINIKYNNQGKKILITVAIHGDEICGFYAVKDLLEENLFFNSKIYSSLDVLIGSPMAFDKNTRFINRNLNRCFSDDILRKSESKDYEINRAKYIANIIDNIDVYIDIHSTSADTPPYAIPVDNKESIHLATSVPVKYIINNIASSVQDQSLAINYAYRKNKTAIIFECGKHNKKSTISTAKKIIKSIFLGDNNKNKPIQIQSIGSEIVGYNFQFVRKIKAFEKVEYGELIAINKGKEVRCPFQNGSFIIMPTDNPIINEEAWVWGVA